VVEWRAGEFMPRRLTRSVLIGGLATGAIQILDVRATFGADLKDFFSIYAPFSGQPVGADGRLISSAGRPSLGFFQQYNTSVSHSSTSSFDTGILNAKAESSFQDTTKTEGNVYGSAFVGNGLEWQKNQVGYSNSQVNIGDTIRVKTRFGASTYDASEEFFNSLSKTKTPEAQRALRFSSIAGPVSGVAALTRTEADVLKFGDINVTLFQQFSRVNSSFEDVKFSDKALRKQTKEDVFSAPDRQTNTYGVSLAQGSSGVMFSQSSLSDLSGTASSFYREQRFDSKAWLGLREIAGLSNSTDSVLGNLVPSNVWVGYGEGAVKQNVGALTVGPEAVSLIPATTDPGTLIDATIAKMDAGLYWQWGSTYASMSAWRSQQVGNQSVASVADGGDASLGVQQKNWSANAYMSLSRWSSQDGVNYSGNYNVGGGASFSVLLGNWPNVTLSFDVTNYDGAYTAWDGRESGRTTSAGIAFDFSKYLIESRGQKLKFFYSARNGGYDSQWGVVNSYSRTIDHVFGTVFRTSL
jgi:hypothetical protein